MTFIEWLVLIGVIGLALACVGLVGIYDKIVGEAQALRKENEELKEQVENLSSAERVKDFYAEAVQEKLNDKLFEKAYAYYDEKMKWQAKEDALHREIVELRSEVRCGLKNGKEKSKRLKEAFSEYTGVLKDEYLPIISGYFSDSEKETEKELNRLLCEKTDELYTEVCARLEDIAK